MCLHLSLTKSANEIEKKSKMIFNAPASFTPYYHFNGWESKPLAMVKQDDPELIELASWGLLPTQYGLDKRKEFLLKTNTLNATKERLFTSNLYRQFIQWQRCIIFADGLFEPHTIAGVKRKTPYYFKEKNHDLLAFAGLYSVVDNSLENPLYSATIITTEANSLFKEIHNTPNKFGSYRMPLILDPTHYWEWLHTSNTNTTKELLNTFTQQELIAYPVSQDVFSNKIDTNVPRILNPIPLQKGLF